MKQNKFFKAIDSFWFNKEQPSDRAREKKQLLKSRA